MYFDNLTNKQKMFVQKSLFENKKMDYSAFSMIKGEDGLLNVGVIDFVSHSSETYLTYKFTDFELVDICAENGESLVDVSKSKKINSVVFAYNKAMGKFSDEYQQKALQYFEEKSKDENLTAEKREVYANYKTSLTIAYNDINAESKGKYERNNALKDEPNL